MQVKLEKALLDRDNKSCKDIERIQHRVLLLLFLPLIWFQKLLGHNWEKSKTYTEIFLKIKIDIRSKKKERKPEENKYFQNHRIHLYISQLEGFTNFSLLSCGCQGAHQSKTMQF